MKVKRGDRRGVDIIKYSIWEGGVVRGREEGVALAWHLDSSADAGGQCVLQSECQGNALCFQSGAGGKGSAQALACMVGKRF